MDTKERVVIGGRLDEEFEGELKLVFEDGILQKGQDHRHSCGGHVALIVMEAGTNAGAILTCEDCHWRTSFDPKLLNTDRRSEFLRKIFRANTDFDITYYCITCMNVPIDATAEEKCAGCLAKEVANTDLPDDLKK